MTFQEAPSFLEACRHHRAQLLFRLSHPGQRLLGATDARGLVLCRPGAPIGTLQVSLPGWSVFSIPRHPHYEPGSGAVLVLMMRDGSMREAR